MSNQQPQPPTAPQGPAPKGYVWEPKIGQWVPKKKHTGRNVAIVLGILFVLMVGGCFAIVGKAADEVSKDSASTGVTEGTTTTAPKTSTKPSTPPKVTPSAPQKLVKGTQVGPFTLQASVQIQKDALGSFTSRLSIKNHTETEQMAVFKITLLKGDDIHATLDCIGGGGNPIAAGATTTAQCISQDDYAKGWTKVQLEHTGF